MLAGDWNCTPDDLTQTGWLSHVGGTIFALPPSSPTCNGKVYDFFVVAQQISHNVVCCKTVCDAAFSPHSPARPFLHSVATTAWVRQPRPVVAIPAFLPRGPLIRNSSEATFSA